MEEASAGSAWAPRGYDLVIGEEGGKQSFVRWEATGWESARTGPLPLLASGFLDHQRDPLLDLCEAQVDNLPEIRLRVWYFLEPGRGS